MTPLLATADHPEGDGPRIPALKDRIPHLLPLAAEGEGQGK
jgi:hypothetical protein